MYNVISQITNKNTNKNRIYKFEFNLYEILW